MFFWIRQSGEAKQQDFVASSAFPVPMEGRNFPKAHDRVRGYFRPIGRLNLQFSVQTSSGMHTWLVPLAVKRTVCFRGIVFIHPYAKYTADNKKSALGLSLARPTKNFLRITIQFLDRLSLGQRFWWSNQSLIILFSKPILLQCSFNVFPQRPSVGI